MENVFKMKHRKCETQKYSTNPLSRDLDLERARDAIERDNDNDFERDIIDMERRLGLQPLPLRLEWRL